MARARHALVLTDIHMPDMDGFELTRQIRAEEKRAPGRPRTPIVALTANALKGESERCLGGRHGRLPDQAADPRSAARGGGALGDRPTSARARGRPLGVEEMFGDNAAAIARVLGRFRDAGAQAGRRDRRPPAPNPEQLTELAHKLKGAARAAGAMALGDLAATLEKSGRARRHRGPADRMAPGGRRAQRRVTRASHGLPANFPRLWEAFDIDSIRVLADSSHFPITPSATPWITGAG